MEIPLGFIEGKVRGSHFMGPSSRLPCTKFQLGQLDFSLIFFFFLMYWNQCTECRVYDSPPAMVYFHHCITPDFFSFDFFPFFPVSTPGFDSNAGNLTYFQKLPFYFVYIENTCKIYFWGKKKRINSILYRAV